MLEFDIFDYEYVKIEQYFDNLLKMLIFIIIASYIFLKQNNCVKKYFLHIIIIKIEQLFTKQKNI